MIDQDRGSTVRDEVAGYEPPTLTVLGTLSELTAGTADTGADSFGQTSP